MEYLIWNIGILEYWNNGFKRGRINTFFVFDTQYSIWNVPCGAKPLSFSVITHSKNTSSNDQEFSANFSLVNGPKLPYVNGKG